MSAIHPERSKHLPGPYKDFNWTTFSSSITMMSVHRNFRFLLVGVIII